MRQTRLLAISLLLALFSPACTPPELPSLPPPTTGGADADADRTPVFDLRVVDSPPAERPPIDAAADFRGDPPAPDAAAENVGYADADEEASPDAGHPDGTPEAGGRTPGPGDLAIVELLVNPRDADSGREWIEIASLTDEPLDLSGLVVADEGGEAAVAAGVLPPGGLLVVGQSTDPARNGGAPVALTWGIKVSLNNDSDTISLCLGSCASGPVLDRVAWTDLGAAYDGHALVVTPGGGPRCPATDAFGTAGSFGTPAAANPPCP